MYLDIYPTLPVRLSPDIYPTRELHGYYPDMYPPNTAPYSIISAHPMYNACPWGITSPKPITNLSPFLFALPSSLKSLSLSLFWT